MQLDVIQDGSYADRWLEATRSAHDWFEHARKADGLDSMEREVEVRLLALGGFARTMNNIADYEAIVQFR